MIFYEDLTPSEKTEWSIQHEVPTHAICWQERFQNRSLAGKGWEAPLRARPPRPPSGPCGSPFCPTRPRDCQAVERAPAGERARDTTGRAPGVEMTPWAMLVFFPVPSILSLSASPAAVAQAYSFLQLQSRKVFLGPGFCWRSLTACAALHYARSHSQPCHTFPFPSPCELLCAVHRGHDILFFPVISRWEIHTAQLFLKMACIMLGFVSISKRSRQVFRLENQVFWKPQA